MRRYKIPTTCFLLAVGVTACADAGSDSGCTVRHRRCVDDMVQLCLPDPSVRLNEWHDVLDCREYEGTRCREKEFDGIPFADCVYPGQWRSVQSR